MTFTGWALPSGSLLDGRASLWIMDLVVVVFVWRRIRMDKLEKLLEQERQLKARIQKARAQMNAQERKARTGRLISWGVLVEQMLEDPEDPLTVEQLQTLCRRYLKDRTLERALTGPLANIVPSETPETAAP